MNKRLTLRLTGDWYGTLAQEWLLCAYGLGRKVKLPSPPPETIVIVFSKRSSKHAFALTKRDGGNSTIRGYRGYMMGAARELCTRMVTQGYTHVRVEGCERL